MIRNVSITEMSRNLSDYLNRVAYKGEHFLLIRGKKAVAELKPVPEGRRLRDLPALWKTLPRLSKADAEAFSADLTKSRQKLHKKKLKDPWAS